MRFDKPTPTPRRASKPTAAAHAAGRALDSLRQPIRRAVHTIEPTAEIILFGSRARGTATPDSDWDLLILLDGPVDPRRKKALRHRLYEVEWDHDAVLTSLIFDRVTWQDPRNRASPIQRAIRRDGIPL